MQMHFQSMPLRKADLLPTVPVLFDFVLQPEDKKALRVGACAGVCFALAVVSAVVLMVRSPGVAKTDTQAWTPKITVLSAK